MLGRSRSMLGGRRYSSRLLVFFFHVVEEASSAESIEVVEAAASPRPRTCFPARREVHAPALDKTMTSIVGAPVIAVAVLRHVPHPELSLLTGGISSLLPSLVDIVCHGSGADLGLVAAIPVILEHLRYRLQPVPFLWRQRYITITTYLGSAEYLRCELINRGSWPTGAAGWPMWKSNQCVKPIDRNEALNVYGDSAGFSVWTMTITGPSPTGPSVLSLFAKAAACRAEAIGIEPRSRSESILPHPVNQIRDLQPTARGSDTAD